MRVSIRNNKDLIEYDDHGTPVYFVWQDNVADDGMRANVEEGKFIVSGNILHYKPFLNGMPVDYHDACQCVGRYKRVCEGDGGYYTIIKARNKVLLPVGSIIIEPPWYLSKETGMRL